MIVVLSEPRELLPCIFQRRKPLYVETLVPQSAIETLDERILHRPPGPDETQLNPVLYYPCLQGATAELAAVIHCDARRHTPRSARAFSSACTTFIPVMDQSASSHTHSRVNSGLSRQNAERTAIASLSLTL